MKKNRLLSCLLCATICLTVFISVGFSSYAIQDYNQKLQTVKVGFFEFDGYHMMDKGGMRSGYGYEILQHMIGYTDWNLEYVGYDKSWNEMQDMLADGEIDILTSAQKTPDRMRRFDFSNRPIGTSSAILTVKAGNSRYMSADYKHWNGMRVGMLRGNSRNDNFAGYASSHNFSYKIVYFDDTSKMVKALKEGKKIDALLTSNLRSIRGEWVLAEFDPSPFYVMVRKGNASLLKDINSSLDKLYLDEPEITTQLMDKYYTPDNGGEIPFTAEERNFIKSMEGQTLTVAINPDRVPFSYVKNGEYTGIIKDIADRVSQRSGLNMQIIDVDSRSEYLKYIKDGNVDIRFDSLYDFSSAESLGYRLTEPYLDISISKLYKRNTRNFSSLAVLKNSDIATKYKTESIRKYDEVVYYDTLDDVIKAVLRGKQDAAYLYTKTAEWAVQNDETNRLTSQNIYGYDNSFAVAVNEKLDSRVFSILNKTVSSLSQEDIQSVNLKYTTYNEKPFSFVGYVYRNPILAGLTVVIFFAVIALIFILIKQSKVRKLAAEKLVDEKRRGELLSDALAAAESADEAKSRFLSRVSHEMRTPLNAIIGFMTLAKDADEKDVSQYLANSELAAKQLLSVINDVLDVSSIEAGKMKIAHAPFDFKYLIHSLTNIYVAQCNEKGLEYETQILTPMEEWLVGDQLRLNQILMNLLSNAVKFTGQGSVHLKISQTDNRNGKVYIRFEVSDTGCGMTAEMKARLFKPFEQESAATAQKYGGSGLGLSIVSNLVSMMGGAVRVDSKYGEGSSFVVDLPFDKNETDFVLDALDEIDSLHVLTLDDEASECKYISVVLDRINIRHSCMQSCDAALEELARADAAGDPYNICLVDWKMPNVSGIDTTKRIREKYGEDVIVIVVSAYNHNNANEIARDAGANLFISKPLFQSSLLDLFMTITGGKIAKQKNLEVHIYDFIGKRVLIAEDNAMNMMVVKRILEKYGVECYEAEDGVAAYNEFTSSSEGYYDAILMDIQMPNMDGFEATKKIRNSDHPDAQRIQIIALTANAFNEDITKALSGGMNDHVAKPIDPDVLAEALKQAFGSKNK